MSDAYIVPGSAAAFIPEVFSAQALEYLAARATLVNRIWNLPMVGTSYGQGDTIKVPTPGSVTITNLAATGTPKIVLSADTDATVDVVIDKFATASFLVRDDVAKQSAVNHAAVKAQEGLKALVEQIEKDIAGLFNSASTSAGTVTGALDVPTLTTAHARLSTANVPMDERATALHPLAWAQLCADARYTSRDYNPAMPLATGNAGSIIGTALEQTAACPTSGDPITSTVGAMFHRSAMAVAIQISPEIVSQYDIYAQGTIFTVRALYGVKLLDGNRIVKVLSKA